MGVPRVVSEVDASAVHARPREPDIEPVLTLVDSARSGAFAPMEHQFDQLAGLLVLILVKLLSQLVEKVRLHGLVFQLQNLQHFGLR